MYTIIRQRLSPLNSYSQVGSQDQKTNWSTSQSSLLFAGVRATK